EFGDCSPRDSFFTASIEVVNILFRKGAELLLNRLQGADEAALDGSSGARRFEQPEGVNLGLPVDQRVISEGSYGRKSGAVIVHPEVDSAVVGVDQGDERYLGAEEDIGDHRSHIFEQLELDGQIHL